jgi:hypothetical protein
MNNSNICKDFLNQLNQEALNLKTMLSQFINGPVPSKNASYINILIWSKMLIYHVQKNLKKCDEQKFNIWFKKYRLEIFGKPKDEAKKLGMPDKIVNYFIAERDSLEHEGRLNVSSRTYVSKLSLPADLFRYGGPRPANAIGMFMDANGVGWSLKMPNESTTKLYVSIPEEQMKTTIVPINVPRELEKQSIEQLLTYYIDFLDNMVKDAVKEFG